MLLRDGTVSKPGKGGKGKKGGKPPFLNKGKGPNKGPAISVNTEQQWHKKKCGYCQVDTHDVQYCRKLRRALRLSEKGALTTTAESAPSSGKPNRGTGRSSNKKADNADKPVFMDVDSLDRKTYFDELMKHYDTYKKKFENCESVTATDMTTATTTTGTHTAHTVKKTYK